MKVILNQDVHNLGEEGDVKEVARGYARNYLLPQNLAVVHTKGNLALFEHRRAAIEKRKEEKRIEALSLKEKLQGLQITIDMTSGDTGRLFGSVTSANITEELQKLGFQVERKRIDLPEHSLKMTGTYTVKVRLYDNNIAELTLVITSPETRKKADKDEKEAQKEAGSSSARAVTTSGEGDEAPVETEAADGTDTPVSEDSSEDL